MQNNSPSSVATTLVHAMPVFAESNTASAPIGMLFQDAVFQQINVVDGFYVVVIGEQFGFVPVAACAPNAVGSSNGLTRSNVVQPIILSTRPMPGAQATQAPGPSRRPWLVAPDETLLLLGHDRQFALVQRSNGQIGYVPANLCGESATPAAGRIIGHAALGALWFSANALSVRGFFAQLRIDTLLDLVVARGLLMAALIGALWFFAPRRSEARPFAGGALAVYVLAEVFVALVSNS